MTTEITKGATIKITKAARAYTCAGITDPACILPAEVETATVIKITKTKRGRKAHVRGENYGFAIYLDNLPEFMTVEAA